MFGVMVIVIGDGDGDGDGDGVMILCYKDIVICWYDDRM